MSDDYQSILDDLDIPTDDALRFVEWDEQPENDSQEES